MENYIEPDLTSSAEKSPLTTPLLGKVDRDLSKTSQEQSFCRRCYSHLYVTVAWFWTLTTDVQFLRGVAHRHFRFQAALTFSIVWAIPGIFIYVPAATNWVDGLIVILSTTLPLLLTIKGKRFLQTPDKLWMDVLIVLLVYLIVLADFLTNDRVLKEDHHEDALIDTSLSFVVACQILCALGVHSAFVLVFLVGFLPIIPDANDMSFRVDTILVGLLTTVLHVTAQLQWAISWSRKAEAEAQAARDRDMAEASRTRYMAQAMERKAWEASVAEREAQTEIAFSDALSRLKTPVLIARSELQSLQVSPGTGDDSRRIAEQRINELWSILAGFSIPRSSPPPFKKRLTRHSRRPYKNQQIGGVASLPGILEENRSEDCETRHSAATTSAMQHRSNIFVSSASLEPVKLTLQARGSAGMSG